ncbi:MAG: hypothetical protein F6K58_20040 [Symploca sp. SIO2E9]|nr:hypothetical protein [Symploca sp. SIO2E9]
MYRTIPTRIDFDDEEKLFWEEQCRHANSLINCALYQTKQSHYARLSEKENAFTTYWRGDEICSGWKSYRVSGISYATLCSTLKGNEHFAAISSQAAQQILKTVAESLN